ncbi:MAG: cytochrome b/b6 domain-containing protein [Acidiferrobacterales bacterium]|nr:cytochrome b/b6 domain-containing protein [Acidiferrobacterales bacterium]
MTSSSQNKISVRVWDFLIRTYHWLLAVLVAVMYISAEFGNFDVHILAGKSIAILVAVRIVWGFIGSSNARFSALFFRPREYVAYIAQLGQRKPGFGLAHSPIGALAVIAILSIISLQVATGLVASDIDGLIEGPFAYYVDYDTSRWATDLHHSNERLLLYIIGLHLAANAFYYFYKKDNLISPMITGVRKIPSDLSSNQPDIAPTWKAVAVIAVCATIMLWLFGRYG